MSSQLSMQFDIGDHIKFCGRTLQIIGIIIDKFPYNKEYKIKWFAIDTKNTSIDIIYFDYIDRNYSIMTELEILLWS